MLVLLQTPEIPPDYHFLWGPDPCPGTQFAIMKLVAQSPTGHALSMLITLGEQIYQGITNYHQP